VFPSAAKALSVLDQLNIEIENAPSLEAVEAIANAAAGYQRMFKPVSEVADRAGEVWTEAEVRIGAELAKIPKATGTRGKIARDAKSGKIKPGGPALEPPGSDAPTLKDLGVDKKRSSRAKKLNEMPKAKRNKLIAGLKDSGKAVTPAAVLTAARQETRLFVEKGG